MNTFLLIAAVIIVLSVAVALARLLLVGGDADRVMAAQLLGTGGIAALLLFGVVNQHDAVVDVALTLSMLTVFAGIAFVQAHKQRHTRNDGKDQS